MKFQKCLLSLFLALCLFLFGCSEVEPLETPNSDNNTTVEGSSDAANAEADFATDGTDMFTDRDQDATVPTSGTVQILLNGNSISASSNAVRVNGTTAIISETATYVISGGLDNGQLVVDADENAKIQLVFNGVTIHSAASAPLYIKGGDKVFLTLSEGSVNALSNGGSFVAIDENNIDGALFSKQDLTINGSGSLTVNSPAGHGIVCKDDLVMTGGSVTVTAASHGIDANDSVRIDAAMLEVESGKDAIHAENTDDSTLGFVYIQSGKLTATAAGDGIDAGAYLQIMDGELNITAGGGSSASVSSADDSKKGLKAANGILIAGGRIQISAADDAVHSNTSLFINGGTLELNSGDDGCHADETLKITAGTVNISKSYEGLEGLDIVVAGGDISLIASDDGINAAGGTDGSGFGGPMGGDQFGGGGRPGGRPRSGMGGMSASSGGSILISGGTVRIRASGDGIDANGTLEITGGCVTVCGPTQGDTATLDYDVSGTITGGTFIGTGAAGMAQTFSDSAQGVFAVQVGNQAAGTTILITDAAGNVILEYTPELSFAVVIFSSPALVKGESYTITIGELSGSFAAS
ncbi:MAG: carbohydrate-binding domain-containing protein [Clostridia bacterium]|nr:carbohydrate-binding domain-containing protein [Clostridia bacterium]